MNIDLYQDVARRTAIYPGPGTNQGVYYTTLGLVGEAGEIANKVKKIMRDDFGEITVEKRDELVAELGDVLWYVANLASELNSLLSEIALANLEKLNKRALEQKLQGSGDNR